MQALKVSCVGQTFALARGNDSREKKPRRRRTKEERRTMVESFIEKYRNSNNGNFPSLNLTHKEVGGSFYTVREIVRDIIQENKVLGPGSPNLKSLKLEDCFEEHELEHFPMDTSIHLSISSNAYVVDHKHSGISSRPDEHQSEECYESVKSDYEQIYHPVGVSVPQFMHGKSSDHMQQIISHGVNQDRNMLNEEYEEANLGKPSGQTPDSSANQEDNLQVQGRSEDCEFHGTLLLHQSASSISPPERLMPSDKNVESQPVAAEVTGISAESNGISKISEADDLAGDEIFINLLTRGEHAEPFPSAYSAMKSQDSDSRHVKTEGLFTSQEVLEMQNLANEWEIQSMPVDKYPVVNGMEATENFSPSSIDEATNVTSPLAQSFVSLSETSRTEVLPMLRPDDTESITAKTKRASGELRSNGLEEISISECTAEPDHATKSAGSDSSFSSQSSEKAKEELDATGVNPVWATIKAFVAAVIKFWTD